ncbi:MAG: STAS domain-containing protein [Caldilineaceae bacterium]|nr:STAS domain-containing protein [Caldilineaceae bacterium]
MNNTLNLAMTEEVIRIVTIAPQGRLDTLRAGEFRKQLQTIFDSGVKHIVLDLSQTPFLDSAGMAALVSALKQCRERGGDARMVWPQAEPVKRILTLTKFDRVFDMQASVEEAVAAFQR